MPYRCKAVILKEIAEELPRNYNPVDGLDIFMTYFMQGVSQNNHSDPFDINSYCSTSFALLFLLLLNELEVRS